MLVIVVLLALADCPPKGVEAEGEAQSITREGIVALLKAKKPVVNGDATGIDLHGLEARGAVVVGGDWSNVNAAKADFTRACIANVALSETSLRGANLTDAAYTCWPGMVGGGCYGEGSVDLRDANLTRAKVAVLLDTAEAKLDGATLDATEVPASESILAVLATAKVRSVALQTPWGRKGDAQTLSAEEVATATRLGFDGMVDRYSRHPAFACNGKLTAVEQMLCKTDSLAALDQLMAKAYARVGTSAKDAQKAFLAKRNACKDEDCVAAAYIRRLAEMTPESALKAQAYIDDPTRPKSADPVAVKFARAYGQGTASAAVTVAGSTIHLKADSWGANGHSCEVDADVKRSAKTGLYRDPSDGDGPAWLITPEGIVPTGTREQMAYACGARASWRDAYFSTP